MRQRFSGKNDNQRLLDRVIYIVLFVAISFIGVYYIYTITRLAPLGGDDCVNFNEIYNRFRELGFWELIKINLKDLSYSMVPGRSMRYFPFSVPYVLYRFMFQNIEVYRIYIACVTMLAFALAGWSISIFTGTWKLSLASYAMLPIFVNLVCRPSTNALYSYTALAQGCFFIAMIGQLFLALWVRYKSIVAFVLCLIFSFLMCARYELGYVIGISMILLGFLNSRGLWGYIKRVLPVLLGESAAFICYVYSMMHVAGTASDDVSLSLDMKRIGMSSLQSAWGGTPVRRRYIMSGMQESRYMHIVLDMKLLSKIALNSRSIVAIRL